MITKKKITKKRQIIMLCLVTLFMLGSFIVAKVTFLRKPPTPDILMDYPGAEEIIEPGPTLFESAAVSNESQDPSASLSNVKAAAELELFGFANLKYQEPPKIFFISPIQSQIAGGAPIVITGSNFGEKQAGGRVFFGETQATVYSNWTADKIELMSPAHNSGLVAIKVITAVGATATTSNSVFKYTTAPLPVITSVSPEAGFSVGNTKVTLSGSNFGEKQLTGFVLFGDQEAVSYVSWVDDKIVVTTPPNPVAWVKVIVQAPNELLVQKERGFEYLESKTPQIFSVSPLKGSVNGDFVVTISGSNFGAEKGDGLVTFSDLPAQSYTFWSDDKIVVTAPANISGISEVKVRSANGLSSKEGLIARTFKNLKSYLPLPLKIDYSQIGNPTPFAEKEKEQEKSED